MPLTSRLLLALCAASIAFTTAFATSNYQYGPNEYVTVANGISPDKKLAITAHGEGELGDENFHIYLTDAVTGKKIGPLTEIVDPLDTGAGAFAAKWAADSHEVTIVYRIDRHEPLKAVTYNIGERRARPIKGPFNVKAEDLISYWQDNCSDPKPSEKVFGKGIDHE